jgi:cyclophilin family peptidyl-prolyl cis-trans isomerase
MRPTALHVVLSLVLVTCGLSSVGCHKKAEPGKAITAPDRNAKRLAVLEAAELNRDARVIIVDDLTSRAVDVRRRSMQALARIGGSTARSALERGLADEDGQVVAWAAFGLARSCEQDAEKAVAQLAIRGTSWAVTEQTPRPEGRFAVDPLSSIPDAIGRCGTPLAETTLANWLRLGGHLAERAALALGSIAAKHHRLETTTLVALLDAANQKERPPLAALYPFTRLAAVEPNVQKRLLQVASDALSHKTDAQYYAVRSLPLTGDAAVPLLERIAIEPTNYDPELRSDAVRGLARLGDSGQQALAHALTRLFPKASDIASTWLQSTAFNPTAELLENLNQGGAESRPLLESLAHLPLPTSASAPDERRILVLRCQSAALLAGTHMTSPVLLTCDPDKNGRQGALALLRVLGLEAVRGRRATAYERLVSSRDPIVREAALRLMRSHPEIRESAHFLANALISDPPGVVATAASIIAENPERAQNRIDNDEDLVRPGSTTSRVPKPTPEVLLALDKAAHREWEFDAIDVRIQLTDAIAALGALSNKPFLEDQCKSGLGVLRRRAELALRRLGDAKKRCTPPVPTTRKRSTADFDTDVHLRLHTEIGVLDLWLEPQLAPATVGRIIELVKAGFYDKMPVHRVIPGFVAQLGDREGDDFGGTGEEPLRDELAPVTFRAGDVGLALSGPDTGSSQFFVVLGPHPHLDGEYTRIGRAGEGWNRLVVGDVVERVELVTTH